MLDRHCVRCHDTAAARRRGRPHRRAARAHYTVSYNALAPRVSFSAWGGKPGDFREVNSEPLTQPGFFGAARLAPHEAAPRGPLRRSKLDPDDFERLATWMDANALFYGTFDPADQARQRRGERIAGPALE